MATEAASASPSTTKATSTTKDTATSSSPPKQNDRDSNSCRKCVKALREIISGLHDDSTQESSPLTLLKAIIADDWRSSSSFDSSSSRQQTTYKNNLKIQDTEDGVKVELPVTTTLPNLLRRYSSLLHHGDNNNVVDDSSSPYSSTHTLATSVLSLDAAAAAALDQQSSSHPPPQQPPLTIELKCRKCATSGPEGGARAFLMGPQPLSIVLCHNRIDASSPEEVQEILTHELVHLYDVQTLQLDLQQCENLAYSEVRAAKAAECKHAWSQLQPYCVKQKAICATNNLFPLEGRKCIQKVFTQAFHDNRPFDNNNNKKP
jgi:hypothetical protein